MSSEEKEFRHKVENAQSGERLDKLLHQLNPEHSRTYLKELIEKGFVTINQKIATKPGRPMEPGEEIYLKLVKKKEIAAEPSNARPLRLIYEDASFAVIDKPSGMASHPNSHNDRTTVADAALAMFGNNLPRGQGMDRPGIVHRLDRDTTGVMLLAKSEDAFHSLRAQFKERVVEKEYRAIVRGALRFDSDYVEGKIGRDPGNPEKMALHREGGKDSSTFYETLERFDDFSYVRCKPHTGRTHQIRVHLSHLGHPIVGDKLYKVSGALWTIPEGAPPVTRQFLHAHSLSFLHPRTGDRLSFESPLHEDMKNFLNFLRKKGRQGEI